jgi:DNA topoisomerase-2
VFSPARFLISPPQQDYKQFLESMTVGASDEKGAFVKDFKEKHTDTSVYFVITLAGDVAPELLVDDAALLKRLKLEASISTSNMHLFNVHGEITKYDSPNAVLQDFYPIRMDLYDKRRASLLRKLDKEWRRLDNKVRAPPFPHAHYCPQT